MRGYNVFLQKTPNISLTISIYAIFAPPRPVDFHLRPAPPRPAPRIFILAPPRWKIRRPEHPWPQHSRSAIEIYEGSQAHDMNVSQPGTLCRSVLEVIQSAQAVF